ncbi:hypothetical protein HAZT_HAZT002635 [Hyalella azteca]|uniref:Small ribosomal subunit protein uS10m n=1 Tax=Hyalella azteca TaxID=294128 RepID=A0A6A0GP35_HYAAZ|nr:hypothetical protein HAZT_HAZT002635 [Hyalella azteca]
MCKKKEEEPVYDRLIWKLEVYCEGHEKSVLESYARFIAMTCAHLGINAQPAQFGTPTHERLTLLKSIHIHGKHRVQYEMQTYPMTLTLHHLTGSTADTFLEYTQRMCPEGVAMRVTEVTTLTRSPHSPGHHTHHIITLTRSSHSPGHHTHQVITLTGNDGQLRWKFRVPCQILKQKFR